MRIKKIIAGAMITAGFCLPVPLPAQNSNIIVQANKPIADVQPTMWGIFFEDINMGADGGIYAELVKNRSFEFYMPLMGWTINQNKFNEGSVVVLNRPENTANPRFVCITKKEQNDSLSMLNEGFQGMGIKKGIRYNFSVMYRQHTPGLTLQLELL